MSCGLTGGCCWFCCLPMRAGNSNSKPPSTDIDELTQKKGENMPESGYAT